MPTRAMSNIMSDDRSQWPYWFVGDSPVDVQCAVMAFNQFLKTNPTNKYSLQIYFLHLFSIWSRRLDHGSSPEHTVNTNHNHINFIFELIVSTSLSNNNWIFHWYKYIMANEATVTWLFHIIGHPYLSNRPLWHYLVSHKSRSRSLATEWRNYM